MKVAAYIGVLLNLKERRSFVLNVEVKGYTTPIFIEFTGRIKRNDIMRVHLNQRRMKEVSIEGDGSVSYEDFFNGKMPTG